MAEGYVLVRLLLTGMVVGHLRGGRTSWQAFWFGVGLALTGAAISLLKVLLAH